MALDLADIRGKVRTECGSPSVTDLTDETIDAKINGGLRRIRQQTVKEEDLKLGSITCVAGQQAYDLPTDEEVEEWFWGPSGTLDDVIQEAFVDQFSNIPGSTLQAGTLVRRSDIIIQQLQIRNLLDQWQVEVLAGKVYVKPTPVGTDQKIYYLYWDTTVDITTFGDEWEEAVLYVATALCLPVLANIHRGRSVPLRAGGGGLSAYENADELEAAAERYEQRFQRELINLGY